MLTLKPMHEVNQPVDALERDPIEEARTASAYRTMAAQADHARILGCRQELAKQLR